MDHLPDSSYDAVEELDREAIDRGTLAGKWMLFRSESEVDSVWNDVAKLVSTGDVYHAKVSTKWGRVQKGKDDHVIIVYTPNYTDTDDVFRVRDLLCTECGVDKTVHYKPDIYTEKGVYPGNAKSVGLPGESRFSG